MRHRRTDLQHRRPYGNRKFAAASSACLYAAQRTALGWMLLRDTNAVFEANGAAVRAARIAHREILCDALNRFWELDEVSYRRESSLADQECEYHVTTEHRPN